MHPVMTQRIVMGRRPVSVIDLRPPARPPSAAPDLAFWVDQVDATHITVRGGTWQRITYTHTGSPPDTKIVTYVCAPTDSTTITWPSEPQRVSTLSNSAAVSAACGVWLVLDCTSTTGTLQVKILTTDPTATAKVYVRKLAEITWASSAITGVYNVVGPVTVDHGEDMVNHDDL
jgi:hypothetical protein